MKLNSVHLIEHDEEARREAGLAENASAEARFWLLEGRLERARLMMERARHHAEWASTNILLHGVRTGRYSMADAATAAGISQGELTLRRQTIEREVCRREARDAQDAIEAIRAAADEVLW